MGEGSKREFTVDVHASLDEVWRALTTPEGLRSWFVVDAKVTPGDGGSVYLDWGGGQAGEMPIVGWDPPNALRLSYAPPDGQAEHASAEEWLLSHEHGITHVRLIMALPGVDEWGGEDDLTRGWAIFFAGLRHWIERIGGTTERTSTMKMSGQAPDRPTAWAALSAELGIPADVAAGTTLDLGDAGSAEVLVAFPGSSVFAATPSGATLMLDLEGEPPLLYTLASTFGDGPEEQAERARLAAVAARAAAAVEATATAEA